MTREILTIGHSNHKVERFLELIRGSGVTAIADVRSSPRSRFAPWFNRDALTAHLRAAGISYVYMGDALGGRPTDPAHYTEGAADYEAMAATQEFAAALVRVAAGAERYRIALMCSEKEPLDCHRCLLVGRRLAERGETVAHVHADGRIEGQPEIEARLIALTKTGGDLFADPGTVLERAYRVRNLGCAYREPAQPARGLG